MKGINSRTAVLRNYEAIIQLNSINIFSNKIYYLSSLKKFQVKISAQIDFQI